MAPPEAGRLILLLFLASLSMGFGALIVAYIVLRAQSETWPPPGTPPLPAGLWLSTGAILASSGTMLMATASVRRGRVRGMQLALVATLGLALVFLVSQGVNWGLAVAARMPPGLNVFSVLFYLLTGLHGAHVLGGLVPLVVTTFRAYLGRYTSERHAGLHYCALYWHFVDVVWLVLFGVLWFAG